MSAVNTMPNMLQGHDSTHPRVLVFSQRGISPNVLYRGPHYEFENIICQIDSATLLAPHPHKWFALRHGMAKRLAWHSPILMNPGLVRMTPDRGYDLFFAICGSPVDLLALGSVANWRNLANTSICLLDEMWVKELTAYKHYLSILTAFDVVMFYYSQTAAAVGSELHSRCMFVPPGIDSILFCPYPECRPRVVDVYSIGRRSDVTHQELLRQATDHGSLYIHDSIAGGSAIDVAQHRMLLANLAKRSRYFIVNPALVDRPDVRGEQSEIGNRYFEGAASGAVMIGDRPKNREFDMLFDWPDAVVNLPFGSGDINRLIAEMDSQPDRLQKIRNDNVVNALMRHDWVYRWETVLKAAGIEPMRGLLERKERLRQLASSISAADTTDHNPADGLGSRQTAHLGHDQRIFSRSEL